MNTLKFLFPFLLLPFFAAAQQVKVEGLVFNTNNMPLDFANVMLLKPDSTIYNGAISEQDGSFLILDVAPGSYIIKASTLGYRDFFRKINISGTNSLVKLNSIYMEEDSKVLDELVIEAQGSQVRFEVDKKVFSVDQNIASAGGSTLDVLQNIPSIDVDTEGNVALRNNENVEIWINGKPAGLDDEARGQILDQMPAGSVESVEIITNPSAKYSSEGSAGIINLVMKKDREAGYYGSVNAGLSYPLHGKLGEQLGASINFNKGKWDGYFGVSARNMYNAGENFSDRTYLENGETIRTLHQEGKNESNMQGLMTRAGLNYQINDKHQVGVSAFLMNGRQKMEGETTYLDIEKDGGILQDYSRLNDRKGFQNNSNVMLTHGYKYSEKTELNTSLTYSLANGKNDADYSNEGELMPAHLKNQQQHSDSKNQTAEFKSDFLHNFNRNSKLELGVNARMLTRDSYSETSDFDGTGFTINPRQTDDYLYKEQIYAAYGTFGARVFDKLSIHAGLRGEYAVIDNEGQGIRNPTKSYFQLFPTAFLSYTLEDNNELQLNYTRRINRPRGRQLNAYRDNSDPTNISYGNPELNPEFTNSLELNHIKIWEYLTLSSSLYYKYTTDVIQQVRFLEDDVMNSTYMNSTKSQSAGLEIVGKSPVTRFLNLTGTLNMYYYELFASDFHSYQSTQPIPIHIDGRSSFSWNARLLANVMLSKTLSGQLTGNYRSPRTVSQGTQSAQYSFDLGLKQSFANKKWSVSLTIRDIFNTRRNSSDTEMPDEFIQHSESWRYAPNFRLNVVYNFGSDNVKKKKNRNENNMMDDEMMEDFY